MKYSTYSIILRSFRYYTGLINIIIILDLKDKMYFNQQDYL